MSTTELEHRLHRDLVAIADTAAMNRDDAWDRLASALDDGHGRVDQLEHDDSGAERSIRPVAVAAVVGLLAITAFVLGRVTGPVRDLEVQPARGENPPEVAALASDLDHVASMTDALNAGRYETWTTHFTEGALVFGASLGIPVNDDHFAGLFALGTRIDLTGPCEPLPDATPRRRIRCPIRQTDDFHGAAGFEVVDHYVINFEGDLIDRMVFERTLTSRGASFISDHTRFDLDFRLWLLEAHPDDWQAYVDLQTPVDERARIALTHVEDFVEATGSGPGSEGS